MSISRFQEKLFGKGCGTAILLGCAAIFGGFAFQYFGKANQFNRDPETHTKAIEIVATVGGVPVGVDQVETEAASAQQRDGVEGNNAPPAYVASVYERALADVLQRAALATVATQNGVTVTDSTVHTALNKMFQEKAEQEKVQLEATGALKPGATDADFDEAFKKQTGKTFTQAVKDEFAVVDQDLKDPAKRQAVIAGVVGPVVEDALKAKRKMTNAEVKATFDRFTVKRILLTAKSAPADPLDVRVAAVQKDLKSGKSFEAEMDKFSEDFSPPGKKPSETTTVLTGTEVASDPNLAPIAKLKPGEVSAPIKTPAGTAFFKLVSVSNSAPPDFAKNIERYRTTSTEQVVSSSILNQAQAIVSSQTVWKSPGFKVLYDAYQLPTNAQAGLRQVFEEAKDAIEKNQGFDLKAAQLAEYKVFDELWNAPGADKQKLRADRIKVLNDYLQGAESFEVRKELVLLYAQDHNGAAAADCLLQAAQENDSFDANGERQFSDVAGLLVNLKSSNLLTPDQEKPIADAQERWRKEKADSDAMIAQNKAEEEAERKKAAEEAKRIPKVKPESGSGTATTSPSSPSSSAAPDKTGIPGVTEPARGGAGSSPGFAGSRLPNGAPNGPGSKH